MKFNREEGLTLIELLITIAVIAIVAAISIPVITNVIDSSRTSSAESMQAQVDAFVDRYTDSGNLSYDATSQTFTGSVDLNADGFFSTDEVIETLTVDGGQFAVTAANGVYTVAGGAGSTTSAVTGTTFAVADYGYAAFANDMVWFNEFYSVASQSTQTALQNIAPGTTLIVQIGGVDYTVTAGDNGMGFSFDAAMNALRLTGVSGDMYSHADSTVTSITIQN
jgi:type IV pilus assembly protein PilA